MKRIIRSIVLGGTTALALAAGSAQAHDLDGGRPPGRPAAEVAPVRARWGRDDDRLDRRREYAELAAARERFYRGWRGDRRERARFEQWCAARRAELDGRWGHEHGRW